MKFVITLGFIVLGFSANAQTKRNIKQEEVKKNGVRFLQKTFWRFRFVGNRPVHCIQLHSA